MKLFITFILSTLILFFNFTNISAQKEKQTKSNQKKSIKAFNEFPCYAVTGGDGSPNVLFEYSPATNSFNSVLEVIFAINGGTFGVINENTGVFSPIGEVGIGNGEFGQINLNNIDGLTFDVANGILYATHRVGGIGPGTNDLLLQIDTSTGEVIPNAMQDSNGNPADYAVIQEVFDGTYGEMVYDVEDIAWNPYSQQLFALQSQNSFGVITELDLYTGQLDAVISDLGEDITGGMAVSAFGKLLVTTQSASGEFCISETFLSLIGLPDPDPFCYGEISNPKVEAFDCSSVINDLALTIELDPGIQEPVPTGDEITFLITVYNQGDFDNTEITIINYTPAGLTLSDSDWINLGNGNAMATASGLNPDDVNGNDGQDCMDCIPDWPNQIEDDYAFITVAIEQENNLPFLLNNIQPENCNALGSATVQLLSGATPPFTHQWENIAGEMVHNQTSSNQQYEVPNLKAGGYYVTIKDAANKINTFSTVIPFMAPLGGNTNCNNTCPEYVIVPNGSASGNFMAEQIVEIKGYVEQKSQAVFDICIQ